MTQLVSTDEYETITGQPVDNASQVDALLDIASDAVLTNAHGQNLTSQEYEDVVLYNHRGRFTFPQRPVTDVASVTIDGTVLTTDEYRFTSGGNRRPAYLIRRVDGVDSEWLDAEATVTYTAGWETLPGQIKSAIVAMVEGRIAAGGGQVLAAESLGEHREEYSAPLQPVDMSCSDSTQRILDRLCGVDRDPSVMVQGAATYPAPPFMPGAR